MKVLAVIGTRPEAIKMAPVIQELERRAEEIQVKVCVSAQHREMLDQALQVFDIVPDIDLDLMEKSQSLSRVAARLLLTLDPVLAEIQPDWMLIQGDTTTAMAAALAAFHRQIRLGHVEAGLRTRDRSAPFPEEVNRIIADQVSDLHFAPTDEARRNLLGEGIPDRSIHVTGNTVVDALRWALGRPLPRATQQILNDLDLSPERPFTVLVTAHRRESHGAPMNQICDAVIEIAQKHTDCQVVFPVHPNPEVHRIVEKRLSGITGISLLPPVDYLTLVQLMKRSVVVLTDSGGIQEEAATLGVPVLVLRQRSDRPESIRSGAALLVGTSPARVARETRTILMRQKTAGTTREAGRLYGDGQAARRIVDILLKELPRAARREKSDPGLEPVA